MDQRAAADQVTASSGREEYDNTMKIIAKDTNDYAHHTLDNVKLLVKSQLKADQELLRGPPWIRDEDLQHVGTAGAGACNPGAAQGIKLNVTQQLVAPVVVLAHNRPKYLAKTLHQLLRVHSEDTANAAKFPLFVSVDGGHQPTLIFAVAIGAAANIQVIRHVPNVTRCNYSGSCNLATHYLMLLQLFSQCLHAPRLLFLEDDLLVSPDFFSYFEATSWVLSNDETLWCISAWNDHGQEGRAANSTALYRTDIMPGLGWMLKAWTAQELVSIWPIEGWDDWMRDVEIRGGRQCVFPEVSRTHTFGQMGTNFGEFFDRHLKSMLLNEERIDWTKKDISYLLDEQYAELMEGWIKHATPLDERLVKNRTLLAEYCNVTWAALPPGSQPPPDGSPGSDMLLVYQSVIEYEFFAAALEPMMPDRR
eukprot:gene8428-8611_t